MAPEAGIEDPKEIRIERILIEDAAPDPLPGGDPLPPAVIGTAVCAKEIEEGILPAGQHMGHAQDEAKGREEENGNRDAAENGDAAEDGGSRAL